jgi:hypothetical protein
MGWPQGSMKVIKCFCASSARSFMGARTRQARVRGELVKGLNESECEVESHSIVTFKAVPKLYTSNSGGQNTLQLLCEIR